MHLSHLSYFYCRGSRCPDAKYCLREGNRLSPLRFFAFYIFFTDRIRTCPKHKNETAERQRNAMTSNNGSNIEMQSPTLRREPNDNISEQVGEPSVKKGANGSRGNIFRSKEPLKIEFVVDNVHLVDRISRVLFPLVYLLFAVSYWITWHAE